MKPIVPLLLTISLSAALAASPTMALREGQQEMQKGNLEAAKAKFEEVLLSDSKNVAARNLLRMVEARLKENPRGPQMAALKRVIIPSLNFEEATLDSALDAIKKKAIESSGGKVTPNFVIKPGVNTATPITLKLNDIPLEAALKYVADLAKISVTYEPYAVSFAPLSGG